MNVKIPSGIDRRTLMTFLGAVSFSALPAFGQGKNSYAVLSLLGDKLSVVTHLVISGSHLDHNDKQQIDLPDDAFDVAVARAVRDALKGQGDVALFSTRDPNLFALQDKLTGSKSDAIPSELTSASRELLSESKATHFILITKHVADVSIAVMQGHVGDGKVTGLGYYVDQDLKFWNVDTGVTSRGFFAPFAYLTATLIDAATLRPVSQASASTSKAYFTGESEKAAVPWNILTPTQKVDALMAVMRSAVAETVPKILAGQ